MHSTRNFSHEKVKSIVCNLYEKLSGPFLKGRPTKHFYKICSIVTALVHRTYQNLKNLEECTLQGIFPIRKLKYCLKFELAPKLSNPFLEGRPTKLFFTNCDIVTALVHRTSQN